MLETRASPDRTAAFGDDRHVAYADYGASEGDVVLALHGAPGSRRLWELFDDEARRHGVRILAPDRPGYGRSPPWPERTLSDTEYLEAVLDDAGVGRADVLGFSGGGPHALALATSAPARVESVHVVAGAVPPSFETAKPRVLQLIDALADRTPRLLRGVLRVQTAIVRYAPPSVVATQYTNRDGGVEGDVETTVARDFRIAFARSRQGFVTETRLLGDEWGFDPAEAEPNVALYHGERDDNISIESARRFAGAIGAELAVLDDADHLGTLVRAVPEALRAR